MYILDLIPFLTIPRNQNQILSYFSTVPLPARSLVEISVKKRKVLGLVLQMQTLKEAKIKLRKTADFTVKPINKVVSLEPVISAAQLDIAFWLSFQYFAPLGLCLKTILPPFFNKKKYPFPKLPAEKPALNNFPLKKQFVFTRNLLNHYKDYAKLLYEHRRQQILLVVPEKSYLPYFQKNYQKLNPQIVHSGISNKNLHKVYQQVALGKPLLVIGTRTAAFLPFKNLGLIIADNESNDASRPDTAPRYEVLNLLAHLAQQQKATLVVNDLFPRLENFKEVIPPEINSFPRPVLLFTDLAEEQKNGNFSLWGKELREKILQAAESKEKILLFVPRKGLTRFLFCPGCKETLLCKNCHASLVVHELTDKERVLKCHHCKNITSFIKVCPRCKNFMLEQHGGGTQKVMQKVRELFLRENQKPPLILELSNDTVIKEEDEPKIIEAFKTAGPVILVCTQKIFRWQYLLKADLVGIVNAELSSTFPDFRTAERTLRVLLTLSQMSSKMVVQSYHLDSPALQALLSGGLNDFLVQELKDRQTWVYPPFSEIIKLNFKHKNLIALREAKILVEKIKTEIKGRFWEKVVEVIGPLEAWPAKEKNLYAWNIFLKAKELETKRRNELLRLVPSRWQIIVNPSETV